MPERLLSGARGSTFLVLPESGEAGRRPGDSTGPPRIQLESSEGDMAGDELDLSEFEEFSSTAKERAGRNPAGPGGGSGGEKGRPRRWVWLLTGIAFGVLGAIFGPDLAEPYIPGMLQPEGEEVSGPVVAKRVGNDRVLLTVDTEQGALLATFRQRVPEIDLLVEEGDTVTLGIPAYAPLVEDPTLAAVRKGPSGSAGDLGSEAPTGRISPGGESGDGTPGTPEGSQGATGPGADVAPAEDPSEAPSPTPTGADSAGA